MKNKFGERLKELMEEKEYTLKKVADGIQSTPTTISYWINGKRQPTADNILAVAEFFDVSTDYLLGRSEYR